MRAHPALVLNADFRPLNYFPLSTDGLADGGQERLRGQPVGRCRI